MEENKIKCAWPALEEFVPRQRAVCSRDIDQYPSLNDSNNNPSIYKWGACCEGAKNYFSLRTNTDWDADENGCYPTLYQHDRPGTSAASGGESGSESSILSLSFQNSINRDDVNNYYSEACEDICIQPPGGTLVNYPYGKVDTYKNSELRDQDFVPEFCNEIFRKVHADDPTKLDLDNFCKKKPAWGFPVEGQPNPDYETMCGCHYPENFYTGTLDAIGEESSAARGFVDNLKSAGFRECWYDKCRNSALQGFPHNKDYGTCDHINITLVDCVLSTEAAPTLIGDGTVNLQVNQYASCSAGDGGNVNEEYGQPSSISDIPSHLLDMGRPGGSGQGGGDSGSSSSYYEEDDDDDNDGSFWESIEFKCNIM